MTLLTHAIRSLLRTPGFTLASILVLGGALGASAAILSVFSSLYLRPLSFADPEELVRLRTVNVERRFDANATSWPFHQLLERESRSFVGVAVSNAVALTLQHPDGSEQVQALSVTSSFLPTLRVNPQLGRFFSREDDQAGGPLHVVLSDQAWRRRFGAVPDIVGRIITLNGRGYAVLGVLPPGFEVPTVEAEFLVSRPFDSPFMSEEQVRRGATIGQATYRLAPGVTLEVAAAEVGALQERYRSEFPGQVDGNFEFKLRSWREELYGNLRNPVAVLLVSVGGLLLIATANVGALFMGRSLARGHEDALRVALGANKWQLARHHFMESALFTIAACVVGVILGIGALAYLHDLLGPSVPWAAGVAFDRNALLGVILLGGLIAMPIGLLPVAWPERASHSLRSRASSRSGPGGRGTRTWRQVLVVAEITLGVALLGLASVSVSSLVRLREQPLGFQPEGVVTATLSFPPGRYRGVADGARFRADLLSRLQNDPRVESAAVGLGVPQSPLQAISPYVVDGQPVPPPGERAFASLRAVSPEYLRTMRFKLVEGRWIESADREGAPLVVVISESFGRRLFPGRSPVGQSILTGPTAIRHEIVGVVADTRSGLLTQPPPDELFFALDQRQFAVMQAVVRGHQGQIDGLNDALRDALRAIDPTMAWAQFVTLTRLIDGGLSQQRLQATVSGAFGVIALILTLAGLAGVMMFSVQERTREFGVRVALGAEPKAILRSVLRDSAFLIFLGLIGGWAIWAAGGQIIATQLYQTRPFDLRMAASVGGLYLVAGLVACLWPAFRAARTDPLLALRAD